MRQQPNHLYEFGTFRLDAGERLLLHDADVVSLTPKAFDLLLALVEHHGHLLEKEELLKLVWPDTFVEEANLSYNISHVRKALDENGDGQRFIETVPKRGYRFVANVKRVETADPVTELKSRAEEGARASQPSTEAAIDPSPSMILTGEVLTTAQRFNDSTFELERWSPTLGARLRTDTALAASAERAGSFWLRKHERWIWIATTVLAALTASGVAWHFARKPAAEARLMKLSFLPRKNSSFDYVTISPDGRSLAFSAATAANVQIWMSGLDGTEPKALQGTEGARFPFWSPDSHHLGFFVGRKLKKIEVPGGLPETLCEVGVGTGGAWGRDGVILFTSLGAAGVSRVSAAGGDVTSVIRADLKRGETDYKDPSFLPDGRHFLYFNSSGQKDIRGVYVASLDGQVNQRLLGDDSNAVYASSSTGHEYLLFGREESLMAQPFDARQLRLTDEAFSVVEQVGRVLNTHARRNFSVSENGLLVLDPLPHRQSNQLIWVDRAGGKTNLVDWPQTENPSQHRLSPDSTRFIETRFDSALRNNKLWLSDVTSGNSTRFTFDAATDLDGVWSPDGSRIAFCSNRAGQYDLYQKAGSGEGNDELLWQSDYEKHPTDWSRDGRFIIFQQGNPKTKADVWVLPVAPSAGDHKPSAFLQTVANEGAAVLSPDGQWMAYISDESDRYEVYVQKFPNGGSKRQISMGGGLAPLWRADGKELFFHAPDGKLMSVKVKGGSGFEAGKPEALFAFRDAGNRFRPYYSVTSDGHRFLLSTIVDNDMTTPLTVIVNWSSDLKR